MKILVVGSGGREHAIAWKLARSPRVARVFVAPGNAGTAAEEGVANVELHEIGALIDFARREQIAYTVVGPEAPLAAGIVDQFRAAGLAIFGPTQAAARLESSKDYAKQFMLRHRIPTAAAATFTDAQSAHDYIGQRGAPIVIKADGLAAGKGVVVAQSTDEAHGAVHSMLTEQRLGAAGGKLVIEDFLDGEEASFIVMVDGENVLPLATSQDHKRLRDGDEGPNTGGMGAYSPAPLITPSIHAVVMREIILPTVQGMIRDSTPYTGFLYAGLMVDRDGNPKTLEFNCRLGDPETQPILMRLKSDLAALIERAIHGKLADAEVEWDRRCALGVVLAAEGYPEQPAKGDVITGLPRNEEDVHVFHAGTALRDKEIVTNGGRVLCVSALGDSIRIAKQRAYHAADAIHFRGRQMRRDIGWRASAHPSSSAGGASAKSG